MNQELVVNQELDLIRISDVCKLTTLKKGTIYKLLRYERFPKPIKLLDKLHTWPRQDVIDWIHSQKKA